MSITPPHVIELEQAPHPHQAVELFAHLPHVLLLESSMRQAELGRYSFLAADPVDWFQPKPTDQKATFQWLDQQLATRTPVIPELPPFQGGVAGLLNYEFSSFIESIPTATPVDQPTVALGVYDTVVAWDHHQNRCWIISTGIPETDDQRRNQRAIERSQYFQSLIENRGTPRLKHPRGACQPVGHQNQKWIDCPGHTRLLSNFDQANYLSTIQKALDYIHAGDIFQVNIAQQLRHPAATHALELYQCLRVCNPATFSCYFDTGLTQVISASPERLVSVRDQVIETRPIKGTRRRTRHPEVDIDVGQQLLASEKDRAENVMIVDLMRNDLSRICQDDTVRVTQFVKLESYASVLHLVSAVEGHLRPKLQTSDLLKAVFPGGSISGAPKVRAMEIIAELETRNRGSYCGSLGYFGFNGNIDMNILIRTIQAADGYWTMPVGGGIVADSIPIHEYEETWTKAHGMLNAVDLASKRVTGVVS